MSKHDVSRWNRAGLRRVRYVGGNAATYLEQLREQLRGSFKQEWPGQLDPPLEVPLMSEQDRARAPDTVRDLEDSAYNAALIEQYEARPGDLAWAIARTFARACHVLTEHIDAHANDGFLRTATQWKDLQRIVRTIDYHPAGATSATTLLVLQASGRGLVEAGLRVRSRSTEGPPVVFETLEPVEVDEALNELRHARADESAASLGDPDAAPLRFEVPAKLALRLDQPALLSDAGESMATSVRSVDAGSAQLTIELPAGAENFGRASARLGLGPRWSRRAWLNGPRVVRTRAPHGLNAGAAVAWLDGQDWRFVDVADADRWGLLLAEGPLPPAGTPLYLANAVSAGPLPAEGELSEKIEELKMLEPSFDVDAILDYLKTSSASGFPFDIPTLIYIAIAIMAKDLKIPTTGETPLIVMAQVIIKAIMAMASPPTPAEQAQLFAELGIQPSVAEAAKAAPFTIRISDRDLLYLHKDAVVRAQVDSSPAAPRFVFDGTPPDIGQGDPMIVRLDDATRRAMTIDTIEPLAGGQAFAVTFTDPLPSERSLVEAFADFRAQVGAVDARNNSSTDLAEIPLARRPEGLRPGRAVLLSAEGVDPVLAIVDRLVGEHSIVLSPAPGPEFTQGSLRIHANVVMAGHGQRRRPRLLSGGPALRDDVTLVLDVEEVSTRPDALDPRGARPDLEISIGGERWEIVSRLDASEATDPHVTVWTTPAGFVEIGFGDGRRGRRCPPGRDNVQVSYRVGAGRRGLLPAGSLSELLEPHRLVGGVMQPLDAGGGEDREAPSQIREHAPGTLLALERAVSLTDFEKLAISRQDVWHARARLIPGGMGTYDLVEVAVVPSGGVPLQPSDPLAKHLREYLQHHAVPNVRVHVLDFVSQPEAMSLSVRVRSARFAEDRVRTDLRDLLARTFSIERRGLGAGIQLSELYLVVEGAMGIEDSVIHTPGQAGLVASSWRHAVHIDPDLLTIDVEEYEP